MNLAFFISSHGFGHAARAAAVMAALHAKQPALHFEIFTQVPRWFFEDSLAGPFTYHSTLTDIGLVQASPLSEDLPQTVERLNEFLPFDEASLAELSAQVGKSHCALVLCDISPLGITVARAVGIPSVLIENFTWDWLYEGYVAEAPGLQPHIDALHGVFNSADYHLQTAPACDGSRPAHLVTRPVSRSARTSAAAIREHLGIPAGAQAVLLTMGGMQTEFPFVHHLNEQRGIHFVIPGGSLSVERRGNVALLPFRSEFYHPDLLNACDAVAGKLGYSTLAEAYQAGIPFGYLQRPRFRESPVLAAFVQAQMRGLEIPTADFEDGCWLSALAGLLAMPRIEHRGPNGAIQVAEFIADLEPLQSWES